MKTVGENIRAARKRAGLTQKNLADRCGMYDSQIRSYELLKVQPGIDAITKIANGLQVPVAELLSIDLTDYMSEMTENSDLSQCSCKVIPKPFPELEMLFREIGHKISYSYNEENNDYSDFSIETLMSEKIPISKAELDNLNSEIILYFRFRLQELLKDKR